jgi:hypothetical protein
MNRRQVTACFFLAFFPLILNFNSLVHGRQDDKSDTFSSSDFFAKNLPFGNLYAVKQAKPDKQTGSGLTIGFMRDSGFVSIDYRFLSLPEVQEELKVTDRQRERLRPIFEEIFECDIIWKWELACGCAPARAKATERLADLRSRLENRVFLEEILTNEQLVRLAQLENRFSMFSPSETGKIGDKFLSQLALDSQQIARISEVVTEWLDNTSASNASWEKDVLSKALKSYLGDERFDLLTEVSDGVWFSREPLIRSAQMSPFFAYRMIENFKDNSATQFLNSDEGEFQFVDPLILPNGRMVSSLDYRWRSQLSTIRSPWLDFAEALIRGSEAEQSWYSLTDSQLSVLDSLVYKRYDPNGLGFAIAVVGPPVPEMPNEAVTDLSAYRKFFLRKVEWVRNIELNIESTLRSEFVPQQLKQLQFAIGAFRFRHLGVQIALSEQLLGAEFEISKHELAELQQLVFERRKAEHVEFRRIESVVLSELTDEQQKVFSELFGAPSKLFPSFVSHWRGDSLNYEK